VRRLAVAGLTALALTGCGAPSADLFEITRTGSDADAAAHLVVNDGGTVTCSDGKARALQNKQLLTARELARQLEAQAALSIELPPASNSLRRYLVRTEAGRVAFSDTSLHKPHAFDQLIAFTQELLRDCAAR
jgi:hypothetical protein